MSFSAVAADPPQRSSRDQREFSFRERILLWLISWAGYLSIAVIGPTLRFSISWEEEPTLPDTTFEKPVIYSFWHRAVFPAAWMWKKQRIAVMVSQSFDGEYIARIIQKLGFGAIRGSSSRGGTGALLGLKSVLESGESVAFTIDGPRGPKYVAKAGPVMLSEITGIPMAAFYVALSDRWVLKTWDAFMIPKPFSKALMRLSRTILVPSNPSEAQRSAYQAQLQESLERVTTFAEENVARVGSSEFPIWRG